MKDQIVLAIDYGTKRIGLAISQSRLAVPLKVLEYDQMQSVIQEIKKVCDEHQVERLIIGLSEQQMAVQTRNFALALKKEVSLPQEFIDETLSSKDALEKLKDRKKRLRGEPIDHFAAALILREWLDINHPSSK